MKSLTDGLPAKGSHMQMTQVEYVFASGSELRPWNFLGKRVLQVYEKRFPVSD